jgi:hypothetical protein
MAQFVKTPGDTYVNLDLVTSISLNVDGSLEFYEAVSTGQGAAVTTVHDAEWADRFLAWMDKACLRFDGTCTESLGEAWCTCGHAESEHVAWPGCISCKCKAFEAA